MKFKYTILYVENVRETLNFYVAAFGMTQKFIHDSGDYGELDTGETTLSFSALSLMRDLGKSPAKASPQAPVFELAFETDTVEASLQRALDAGASLVMAAKEQPWGQTISYVSDPNGFLVEICSPIG